jgi:peptidoglycan hydrolase-like protein with peptidoglycan-binding domain
MVKKIFTLALTVTMVFTMSSFADTDTTTSATYQAPETAPAETPAPAETKPSPAVTETKPAPAVTETKPAPAAEVTETSAVLGARLLQLNASGEDVKALQVALNTHGYGLVVDGIFGAKTEAALKAFQAANGLVDDGILGPKTNTVLSGAVDAITTASIVNANAAFKAAIGVNGTWIITTLNDLTFDEPLVMDGLFYNGKQDADGNDVIQRKIGLYTQDDDHNVTASFSLTAPSLTVKSLNARIQNGVFNGDLYIEADNFQLKGATVNGNVYFATQSAKDTFTMDDASAVNGATTLIEMDAETSASISYDAAAFEKALGTEGTWIIASLQDLSFDHPLTLTGTFYNGKQDTDGNDVIQRKIAVYSQDDAHNITRKFTLTAPKLTIESPNARIQGGIFVGDVYVAVPNFQLVKQAVQGNIYFMSQEAKDTFKMDDLSSVTGEIALIEADAVTTASINYDQAAFEKALSEEGTWIIASLKDMTFDHPLTLTGTFYNGKQDADGNDVIQRKIAVYSQDADHNITRKFTLTAPYITIESPNARIQGGIFVGDLYVDVNDFQLVKQAVVGNVYFTSQEAMDTFKMDDLSSVSGTMMVTQ